MTTIEHCPPRAMFQKREWPEGFEFASCDRCNHGSADDDLIVAMLARIDPFEGPSPDDDGKFEKLISSVHQQHPTLLSKMFPSASEARRLNKQLGLQAPSGGTHQETGVVKIPPEVHTAVGVFAGKLAKALYYQETSQIFPKLRQLAIKWVPNADLVINGKYRVFDAFAEISGIAPVLKRGRTLLNDQFAYKLSMSAESDFSAVQAKFGFGFALVVLGCTIPNRLNDHFAHLSEVTGRSNPFTLLKF